MLHPPASWHLDKSVTYPQGFHEYKFVIIPPQEKVKTTSTVYDCTKYLVYEKIIIELKITSFIHETVNKAINDNKYMKSHPKLTYQLSF